jgi:HD-like signal output (HDOD) protein
MDGYELLSKMKEKYPKVIRIILSGYTDERIIFKALLHNIAKFYIYKPWSNQELLRCMEQLFETEDLLNSKDLLLLINNTEELPTLQTKYQRILNMIDGDMDIGIIATEIEKDLAISTKLLHVANAAIYRLKTGSIRQASVYIGLQNLKSLIYATSIINLNSTSQLENNYTEHIWKHALLTNKILHYIYETFLHKKLPDTALSAGLLHNIGIVFFIKNFFQKYIICVKRSITEDISIVDLECSEFKVTHQETGGYLVSWWGLPFPIVEAALFHHRPFDAMIVNTELVACVHIAQSYDCKILIEPDSTIFYTEVFERIATKMELFEEKIQEEKWD